MKAREVYRLQETIKHIQDEGIACGVVKSHFVKRCHRAEPRLFD